MARFCKIASGAAGTADIVTAAATSDGEGEAPSAAKGEGAGASEAQGAGKSLSASAGRKSVEEV